MSVGACSHGQGVCEYANGDRYDGAWIADQRSGLGTCRYGDGAEYRGQWKLDLRSGQGECKYVRAGPPTTWITAPHALRTGQGSDGAGVFLFARRPWIVLQFAESLRIRVY